MPSLIEIKKRISNVSSIEKISQSMKLISTSRLSYTKTLKEKNSDYYNEVMNISSDLFSLYSKVEGKSGLLAKSFSNDELPGRTLIVFISSDSGLCGSYNSNVVKYVDNISENKEDFLFLPIGKKSLNYAKRNFNKKSIIKGEYPSDIKKLTENDISYISNLIISLIKSSKVSSIRLVYTHNKSILEQITKDIVAYPLNSFLENKEEKIIEEGTSKEKTALFTDEGNFSATFENTLSQFFNSLLYIKLVDSALSEYASRLNAMDNASNNSKDLKSKLQLQYNRARQGIITKELVEIISGSEAVN